MPEGYDRRAAVEYARRWAMGRNPRYFNFTGYGGDCTNFVSQCLRAGGCPMNYTPDLGWYYNSPDDRAAAWTGVEYLHRFLAGHTGPGPRGEERPAHHLLPGDVIQLVNEEGRWYHSLLVLTPARGEDLSTLLIAAHSIDSLDRPLSSYRYAGLRGFHITL